jgi:hypothetical protein
MSAVCPVYPYQQTFPDPVGTSHLGQKRTSLALSFVGHSVHHYYASVRRLDRLLADKLLSPGRLSEYPTDYFVGICIEISAMAEQNMPRLPRVDFSDCRLRLLLPED